jgi:hypothetical protein
LSIFSVREVRFHREGQIREGAEERHPLFEGQPSKPASLCLRGFFPSIVDHGSFHALNVPSAGAPGNGLRGGRGRECRGLRETLQRKGRPLAPILTHALYDAVALWTVRRDLRSRPEEDEPTGGEEE